MKTNQLTKTLGSLVKNTKDNTYILCTEEQLNNPDWIPWPMDDLVKEVESELNKQPS